MSDRSPHLPVHSPVEQPEEEVLAYWTDDRMAKATPARMPIIEGDPPPPATGPGAKRSGPIQIQPGIVDLPAETGTVVANPGMWPYACVGKLFFTMDGTDYVGTAFAVSGSKSAFMTAGHCVYDQANSSWSQNTMLNLTYTPTSPGTAFAAVKLVTCFGWIRSEGQQYDLGAGVVSGDMFTGRGNFGLQFNQPDNTGPWTAVGYPAGAPYPGNTMYQAVGSYVASSDAGTIGMNNNDMTGGSSGGPWVENSNWGYANGLQSYRPAGTPTNAYSPYFGEAAYNIWLCAVANQGCNPA